MTNTDRTQEGADAIRGVKFAVDEAGRKEAVIIDLKKNAELWEDSCDRALVQARKDEPREPLESVKERPRRRRNG